MREASRVISAFRVSERSDPTYLHEDSLRMTSAVLGDPPPA